MSSDTLTDVPSDRLSASEIADETHRLLSTLPNVAVAAIAENGLFSTMPQSVPLSATQAVIEGHSSALELVARDDIPAVIDAWQASLRRGVAQVEAHPLTDPTSAMTIHFVDSRTLYGVILCFVDGDVPITDQRGHEDGLRPRVSVVRKNEFAQFTQVDTALEIILGHTDLVGRRNLELVHPDDQPRAIGNWIDMLGAPGANRRVRLRQQHRDGHWVWFEITNRNRLNDPAERCVIAEMIDISEEMAAHEFVVAQETLLRRLTDTLPVGVVQVDSDGLIVHRNVRLTEIVGRGEARTLDRLFAGVVHEDRVAFAEVIAECLDGVDRNIEVGIHGASGDLLRCNMIMRPIEHNGAIICIDDVTERALLRDELQRRATYDALTGCLNRASLLIELERALPAATGGVAVVFIDLDGFKAVNDRLGHAAGDALLADFGQCLQESVRDCDLVGRFGGDEFIALGTGVPTRRQALTMGKRLAAALAKRFVPHAPHHAVASIGVSWVSQDDAAAMSADALIGWADAAMYRSKAEGLGRPVLHQGE